MKGIILAGGLGTRLRPLTATTNKHLLTVGDRPMVDYPIGCLVAAGIEQVLIVTGVEHADAFARVLGDGSDRGIGRLEFAYQHGEGGIADALRLGVDFAEGERVCVVLGDNILEGNLRAAANQFAEQRSGAMLLLARVGEPQHYGVAEVEDDRIVQLVEKPADPPSDLAVTGIYFYDGDVFDICNDLSPSDRGELEITDVNARYLRRGDLTWSLVQGGWVDAGTFEGLHHAAALVAGSGANRPDFSATTSPA